jgi:hypothetical protein
MSALLVKVMLRRREDEVKADFGDAQANVERRFLAETGERENRFASEFRAALQPCYARRSCFINWE